MSAEKFRFKIISYEKPNRNFSVNYDGKYVHFRGLDENAQPLQLVFAMDEQVLSDLQQLMRPEIEELKKRIDTREDCAKMYWELKNEVDGFALSYGGSITEEEDLAMARQKTLKILDYLQTFLSKSDMNYHSLEKLKGFVLQF